MYCGYSVRRVTVPRPHNAGVEGSSPSLSTNGIHEFRAAFGHERSDQSVSKSTSSPVRAISRLELSAAMSAVREAVETLEHVSSEWCNGDARVGRPALWSAAIPAAWRALSRALRELESLQVAGSGSLVCRSRDDRPAGRLPRAPGSRTRRGRSGRGHPTPRSQSVVAAQPTNSMGCNSTDDTRT